MKTRDLPWIISVDDHVIEPPDLFRGRLPANLQARAPKVVRLPWTHGAQGIAPAASGPEVDFWQVEDLHLAVPAVEVAAGMAPEQVTRTPVSYDEMRPGCYQVPDRLRDMDVAKIERSLCFPNVIRFAGQLFLRLRDKELALACARAYNDFMVEQWAGESGGRLIPLCVVPLWDAELAAQEVRRNAARGVRGVTFTELPSVLGLPSIHDESGYWLPFIEACDETATVICMHIGSSSTVPPTSPDAPGCVRMTVVNFNAQLAFAEWVFSGLLPRYPTLKLAFSESQIGWMPYMLERMDRIWRTGNAIAGIDPAFVEAPSSYLKGRVFGCFFEDDYGIANLDKLGIDHVTFESDYPHQDSTWPRTYDDLSSAVSSLSDEDAGKIARRNALRMLALDDEEAGMDCEREST